MIDIERQTDRALADAEGGGRGKSPLKYQILNIIIMPVHGIRNEQLLKN